MRGGDNRTGKLFSYVDLEARVRRDHPLRAIRTIVNEALEALEREFAGLYSPIGRPSIPPEKLLRAMLLQAFYSIRSERQLMERLEYDLLFRWFVGSASMMRPGTIRCSRRTATGCWRATSRPSSWRRCWRSQGDKLLSSDHFSVDGTLIEAWASMKSFRPKDGSGEPPARRRAQCRSGLPWREALERDACLDHRSRSQALSQGPGKEAKLCYMGHALMENRHGLLVDAWLTQANGHAERVAALHMIEPRADRPTAITLGADKAYDAEDFVNELRSMKVTPHVAQNTSGRCSAIDGRTTRHGGYAVSQRIRKRIEEASAGSRRSPGKRSPASWP